MRLNTQQAIERLNRGEVVALPTETVYGLAASLKFPDAINRIFTLKNRPQDNPLIIHIAHLEQMQPFCLELPQGFDLLANAFWPGPLTIVVPIKPETIPVQVRAGLSTAAFRIPSGPLARAVIEQTGPIVMPSANISGRPSSTQAEHVEEDFGLDFPVLDGGQCTCGLESTIVIFREGEWRIIRQGALSQERIAEVLDISLNTKQNASAPICPGQKYRHYAPRTHLIPTKQIPQDYVGVIVGFTDRQYSRAAKIYYLGSSNDQDEIAHQLYSVFRKLDTDGVKEALMDMNIPDNGIYKTIIERIHKACS